MNFLKSAAVLVCGVMVMACSGKDATTYHNDIMGAMNENDPYMTQMNTAVSTQKWADAEALRAKWVTSVDDQIARVTKEGDFKGDADFQKSVLAALTSLKQTLTTDYKTLLEMRAGGNTDEAAQGVILNKINNTFESTGKTVEAASSTFEKKYAS